MLKVRPIYVALLAASTSISAQTFTVMHNFGDQAGDPRNPQRGPISQSRGGAMLSTAIDDNTDWVGKAFRIWPNGALQVVHDLPYFSQPQGLTLARDGYFYGVMYSAGAFNSGAVFKMAPDGSVTVLYDFTGGSDGGSPSNAPIQSEQGDFYGTTRGGTVYRITSDGKFTVLHTFSGPDGADPWAPLVQGTDYYFYGIARTGGLNNAGTIYRISRSGHFKVLVNFDGTNGSNPFSGPIQANDGNFYGVTTGGGTWKRGVLYRMTADGTLTVLHNFTGGSDGKGPYGGLVQASDGNLYGTTMSGGKSGFGVIFRATLAGDVVPLYSFTGANGTFCPLLQHTNGTLYGETYGGGEFGGGVFYSLDAGLPPFVTYLPTYGRAGAVVQILGQGFTNTSQVFFNGTPGTVKNVYSTFMKAIVPAGATTGPITVTTSTGTLTSNKVFIVHPN